MPYSSSYSSRSISHGSLPALRTGTNPARAAVARPAPRTRSPALRSRSPCRSAGRRTAPRARRSISAKASGAREQRRDVLEDDARLRVVGDVAHVLLQRAPTSIRPGYRRSATACLAMPAATCACGRVAGAARRAVRAVVVRPTAGGRECLRHRPWRAARSSSRSSSIDRHCRSRPTRPRRAPRAPALGERPVLRLALLPPREQRRGDEDRRVGADRPDRRRARARNPRARSRRGSREPTISSDSTGSSATIVVDSDRISTEFSDWFTISP